MERTWQGESTPTREGGGVLLLESASAVAPDQSEAWSDETPSAFFAMQRTVGNRAVQRMMGEKQIGGRERSVAPAAGPHLTTGVLQAKCACGGTCSACREPEETTVSVILPKKTPGRPLEPSVRADMEARFGEDFGAVRIHRDAPARDSARLLGAEAYTVRNDIYFDAGQYDPTSYRGKRLLAHELTHTVQQTRGLRSARAGVAMGQAGDRYEREADRLAERAVRPTLPTVVRGWDGKGQQRGVEVQERWRGPDALFSRAAATQKPASAPPAAGLTMAQMACIKRVYDKAMAMPKPDRWKRCYVTAQTASCGLPALRNVAALKAALNEAIAPADWELLLADPKGLTCRAQGGQAPEICCEEVRPQGEPARREAPSRPRG